MLGTARTVVESDTQGTVTMEHTESPRTQVVNQPTLTVRAMKPSSASLTAAIARPPSAHLASPAASSKQIPADFRGTSCFVLSPYIVPSAQHDGVGPPRRSKTQQIHRSAESGKAGGQERCCIGSVGVCNSAHACRFNLDWQQCASCK